MEEKSLQALKASDELTVLPADKGFMIFLLSTANFNWEIDALLEVQAFRTLKDYTASAEGKTTLLKRSKFS